MQARRHRLCAISIHAPRTGSDGGCRKTVCFVHISIHAPRTGSDRCFARPPRNPSDFNPRSPHGERRRNTWTISENTDFNPRSPHGERHKVVRCVCDCVVFQSTLPARGATPLFERLKHAKRFQSTLPARGATHGLRTRFKGRMISIHAPRTGSDDYGWSSWAKVITSFQSTLPARGATLRISIPAQCASSYFNPRSPHGERLSARAQRTPTGAISIHAPRTGSDLTISLLFCACTTFQSTLPARGATRLASGEGKQTGISIHAPRTGSDTDATPSLTAPWNFNPRSPHGERRTRAEVITASADFNPRSPHGERQFLYVCVSERKRFQSTLPARGATTDALPIFSCSGNFNPRSPHGERLISPSVLKIDCVTFQSTLPARGATLRHMQLAFTSNFNPRSPHGERLSSDGAVISANNFNPRSPHGERPSKPHPVPQNPVHFNPRSPHGERRLMLLFSADDCHFNPRSPHGERLQRNSQAVSGLKFQSTLPARGATFRSSSRRSEHNSFQSTLPARGATLMKLLPAAMGLLFQSTLPARGATASLRKAAATLQFQSTLPARGATDVD